MKTFSKNFIFALISLVLISLIFYSGYFFGKENSNEYQLVNLTNRDNLSDGVDLEPFWEVWDLIDEKFAPATSTQVVDNQERVWGAISGMVNSLNDPYTEFLPPKESEEFNLAITGEFSGVGMEIGIKDEILTVISPLKDTPADKAGLKPEDRILAIDGEFTRGITVDQAVSKIRGERGTIVVLTIAREGVDEPFDVDVMRDQINIPTLKTEIVDDTFVISLYNFSAGVTGDFRKALREFVLSKKNKLIIDLRGNPGGFLDAAVDIASWFLPAGKVIVREDFGNDDTKEFRSKGYDVFNENLKMAILVNEGSASASEILAGALQEHGVAIVVGAQTFGKGSVQELIDITEETSLKVTIAQWLTPGGKSISNGGLEPDFIVDDENTPDDVDLDEHQLKEAIRLLKELEN